LTGEPGVQPFDLTGSELLKSKFQGEALQRIMP
jgi:hypothetical protein